MARHRRRTTLILAAVTAALVATAPASGEADVTVPVRAHVTYTKHGPEYRNLRLSITRGGRAWRSGPLGTTYLLAPELMVRDLDADGEPEVWLDKYSGGAHCCLTSEFFRYRPGLQTYTRTAHGWGNIGYRPKNLDRRDAVELISADDRFAYVFTPFAASFFPLQVWQFDSGRLRDVTSDFPRQIELDAQQLLRTYSTDRNVRADPRGVLAAWLADQYLLGREREGWLVLETAYRRGELGPKRSLAGWPQGRSYLTALRAYLKKLGYATGPITLRG